MIASLRFLTKENNMFRQMIKKSIHKSQHCNRNWDLSKKIPQEDIDLIIQAATQCPAKQNLNHYKTHVITDRALIEEIESASEIMDFGNVESNFKGYPGVEGYDQGVGPTNSQLSANLVLAFTKDGMPRQPDDISENAAFREPRELEEGYESTSYKTDRDQAVGIAAGYVNLVSTMLGYSTGCCRCFDMEKVNKALGVVANEDYHGETDAVLLMGIGIPDPTRQRQEHHTDRSFRFSSKKNMRTFETHYA